MHLKRTLKSTDKDRTCFSNSTVDYSNNPSSYLHAPNQTSYAGGSEWSRHHERRYSVKELFPLQKTNKKRDTFFVEHISFLLSLLSDSNQRPRDYKSRALAS